MYQSTILENGIRVITDPMPQVRSVSIGILVEASPRVEPAGQAGIAHLAEHMLFQGTSNRCAAEIAQFMDRSGGHIGAFTGRDYTCYYATVLDDYRTYALDLLGDIFLNSIFPEDRLTLEKQAIQRELAIARDAPEARVHDMLKAHCWLPHPLGRLVAGSSDSIEKLTREDVIYFVHQHYLPDGLTIAAAGNLEHEDFVSQVRDAFWRMLGDRERAAEAALPEHRRGVVREAMPVSQNYFALGIPAPPYTSSERYEHHLIVKMLGGGISSRLFRELRESRGLVYQISADLHAYRQAGMLVVEGSCANDQLDATVYHILNACRQLARGELPVTADELWKTRMQMRGQHVIESENTHTRMSRLANQCFYFGDPIPSEEILANIERVDASRLQQSATTWLTSALQRTALSVVGPGLKTSANEPELEQLLSAVAT